MKALFDSEFNVIKAAISRAGLSEVRTNQDHHAGGDIAFYPTKEFIGGDIFAVAVNGSTNAVMRLIGALADDGQECLISCK